MDIDNQLQSRSISFHLAEIMAMLAFPENRIIRFSRQGGLLGDQSSSAASSLLRSVIGELQNGQQISPVSIHSRPQVLQVR